MLIDWVTVVAQIINFLILVAFLKHFLYAPITKAMQKREDRIAARLQESQDRIEEAQQEAEIYRQKQRELEAQKEEWLKNAREEVQQERKVLTQQAKAEIDVVRARWYEGLEREKQSFLQALRQRAGQQIAMVARRVLGDLANVSLEHQIVQSFIDRLQHLDEDKLQAMRSSPTTGEREVLIRTTFPIPPEDRSRLISAIQEQITRDVEVKFETVSEPMYGIELCDRGYRISWHLDHYLEQLEADMEKALANTSTNVA